MATRTRRGRGSKADFQIRTVRTKEDRRRPSVFMRLKADESFRGVALFEPDPEAEENPGYYEYYDHYDNQANTYVPCAGDKCPFCAANDNPSTRALTAWYFPDADVKDKLKLFTMNYGTINDITDESDEEDGLIGKSVRIKRMDDRGSYKVKVLSQTKPLTKKQLQEAMKLLEELFPNGLEAIVMKQLQTQMERLKAIDALDDDEDDEDEDETPRASRRGRAAEKDDEEEDDEEEDEDEDEETSDEEEADDDEDEEDEDEDEEATDEDEDEDEEEEEDEDEEEAPTEIAAEQYEVVRVSEKDDTIDVKNDDGRVKMWVGDKVDVDYDELKKGTNVTIDAQQDDEGDWVITAIEVVAETPKRRGRPAGSKSKSASAKTKTRSAGSSSRTKTSSARTKTRSTGSSRKR